VKNSIIDPLCYVIIVYRINLFNRIILKDTQLFISLFRPATKGLRFFDKIKWWGKILISTLFSCKLLSDVVFCFPYKIAVQKDVLAL
jgi:hypothetical protein